MKIKKLFKFKTFCIWSGLSSITIDCKCVVYLREKLFKSRLSLSRNEDIKTCSRFGWTKGPTDNSPVLLINPFSPKFYC